jgi:PTH1 family peptidyl-tRNA hydrolase
MKIIVGLGNPGTGYSRNRHNIGFICLNHFARQNAIRWDKKQATARTGSGIIESDKVLLAKPQTYMNLSGRSVSRLVNKFKISLDELIVIHDDLDLSLARIKIRRGGGSGGHKGVESIINELGGGDFIRIRFGIGRPLSTEDIALTDDADIIDFVLSDFTSNEMKVITPAIARVSGAITCLLGEGLEAAMNRYN